MCGRLYSKLASRTLRSEITWLYMRADSIPSTRWRLKTRPLPGLATRMMSCPWMFLCPKARAEKASTAKAKMARTRRARRDESDHKSKSNRERKCFYCDKVGHVRADCRKKKQDHDERRSMSAQNGLTSSNASTSSSDSRMVRRTLLGPTRRLSDSSLFLRMFWRTNFAVR